MANYSRLWSSVMIHIRNWGVLCEVRAEAKGTVTITEKNYVLFDLRAGTAEGRVTPFRECQISIITLKI
jgi:hypothetical protein